MNRRSASWGCKGAAGVALALAVALAAGCDRKGPAPGDAAGPPEVKPAPAAPAGGTARRAGAGVELVNKDYDRIRSRMLIRRVTPPTRANLEFAVYDSNVIMHDPEAYQPADPGREVGLGDLDFDGALEADTLVDRIDQTPLTDAERGSPMAWAPMVAYLDLWDPDRSSALAECGAKVSAETWGDEEIPVPFQGTTRVYLGDEAGRREMWVRVEFEPWVGFLAGVDDEDSDGFPEAYGRIPEEAVTVPAETEGIEGDLFAALAGDYRSKVLTREAAENLVFELCTKLYTVYNTDLIRGAEKDAWPDQKALRIAGEALKLLAGRRPDLVIVARPFGEDLYAVLLLEGAAP